MEFIYKLPYTLTVDWRLHTFYFKIVHQIFACKYNLHIWRKSDNNRCEHCENNCIDNLFHYFVDCPKLAVFWDAVFEFYKSSFGISMPLDRVEILFGILNFNNDKMLHCLNFILLTGKFFIYNCKSQSMEIVFIAYCKLLRSLLETKQYIMYKNGKCNEFDAIWSPLLLSLKSLTPCT